MSQPALDGEVLVWDASALHHAMNIDRLDVLVNCVKGGASSSSEQLTTAAVIQELARYGLPAPPQVAVVHVDNLDELLVLASWTNRVSSAEHNRGEATVCAWAEVHQATAIIDDREAREVARTAGLEVHGPLWLVARAVRTGVLPERTASNLVDMLIADGARYPHGRGEFARWARGMGLLP
jgi:predicted nucleic acid-binding protein